jgi:hypothetical protein
VRLLHGFYDHGSAAAFRYIYRAFKLLISLALALIQRAGSRIQQMCTVQKFNIIHISTSSLRYQITSTPPQCYFEVITLSREPPVCSIRID